MERLYIVSYDIREQRRWRQVFRVMKGYGEWLQLSVFQCRLSKTRLLQLEQALAETIDQKEDHVLIVDIGPADSVAPHVKSLGKVFQPVEKKAVIV